MKVINCVCGLLEYPITIAINSNLNRFAGDGRISHNTDRFICLSPTQL